MMIKLVAAGALVATTCLAATSSAETPAARETARRLMDDGDRYVEQQKFDKALAAYESAHAIMHVPTTGIDVALTLTTLGRLVAAREVALEVTRMPGAGTESSIFAEARKDAAELADRLVVKIPTVRLELPAGVDPATVRAWIDGEELADRAIGVPRRLDPGGHTVRVETRGRAPFVREITLKESERAIVPIELRSGGWGRSGEDAILGLPPLAFGGLSAAALGLTVGTITGLVSLDKAADARSRCGPDTKSCDPAAEPYIDASKTYGWISTASFALAIAGGAVATYALVVTTDRVGQRSIGVHATANGALVKGTF
ncbi:MAG: hypothetical protein KF795_29475 [Labilithrix sp.]|nr:hypothetical protein [Labilithrix sp.]